jgi:hypothetical protein
LEGLRGKNTWGNLKAADFVIDLGIGGTIILKLIPSSVNNFV